MKKLLSFLALALCFVACQNEAVESVSNGDLANVVLTIDAPELGVTRADGDANAAKNSAFGAIDFLSDADWANYDLRYILEVYDANEDGTGTPIYRERMVNCLDKYAPTTFELRLVPNREYKFVVFADFVAEGNAELTEPADKLAIADLYYNTADLRNISAITNEPTWNAMNEIRDAYFISKNVNVTTGLNETLTLTRPFAKLRVIATDLDYIKGYSAPGYVEVTYHTEKVYKSFNAVNGLLNAEEMTGDELTYGYEVSKTIPYTAGYDEFSTNQTLFTDYLLAEEGEQTPVNFKMTVYEDASKARKIHEHDFTTQIPIQRNHLTTIIGDLLTTQANITIQIDDNFEDEFVIGWGDDNATKINVWNAGELNANGDYTFVVEGENDFEVTINAAAVENQKLTAGTYVLAEDAEEGEKLTFTVEALQANETTRALVDVEVIGGTMKVVANGEEYAITLDLVLQFVENKDVRHAIYTYEGPIAFGKVLETPKVEYAVEGNVITLTWNAVDGATSYTVSGVAEMPVVTEETSYVFTGEYETEYTFTVVAVSDDLASQPYTVVVTTEAAPVVDPEEPTVLATPVVTAVAKENTVTLTWEAVENAASYSITVGTEMPVVTEELTYTFTGEYETEYTFNVVAVPADEEKFAASEAAVVTATTEAAPAVTPETKSITVAEFLTMPEDETEGAAKYRLTGVITRMYRVNNSNDTLYGNFYLKDATGEVLIYGLMDKDGNKYWETSGVKIGDTITVQTIRASFNGTPQGKNATYISHTSGSGETPEPTPGDVVTIASVLALGEGATINGTIEATVVSNYELNNLTSKKGMYVQDETGALQFYLGANHEFAFGTKVKIDLTGATLASYNGAVQVSGLALDKITVVSTGNTVTAKTVSMADFLANKYEGQYIALDGVQVADADLSKTWVMDGKHTSIAIEDAAGNSFVVFSSKYASYGAETVAQGSGMLKGISSINNGNLQIIFAQSSDYAGLTGNRLGDAGGQEPEDPVTPEGYAGRDDFNTIDCNSSYTARQSTAGWVGEYCAVQSGGANDANPVFNSLLGADENTRAWVINGRTSQVGKITSPIISTGCGTLTFNYGIAFSEKNGYDFNVDIVQNGEVVKTFNVVNADNTKFGKFTFSEEVNVAGDFQIVITNNCPSANSESNKDRYSIWDIMWTAHN